VLRDTAVYNGSLTLEYATSDLTATAVDESKYRACRALPVTDRGPAGCGDYEQTRGLMYIAPGVDRGTFTVRLVDDYCRERFVEYVQVRFVHQRYSILLPTLTLTDVHSNFTLQ
jgi:hypothetical protein